MIGLSWRGSGPTHVGRDEHPLWEGVCLEITFEEGEVFDVCAAF